MIICLDKLPKHFGVQIYMLSMVKHKQCWLHIIFCLAPDFVGAELACVAQWMCGTMDDRTTSYLKVVMVATRDLPRNMGSNLSLNNL